MALEMREVEHDCTLRILLHPLILGQYSALLWVHIGSHPSQQTWIPTPVEARTGPATPLVDSWIHRKARKNHMPSEWIMGGFGHFIKFAKLEETLNPWFPHWLQIVEHWNMGYRTFRDDNLRSPILGKPIWERANMGGIINAMWGQATATF